MKTYFIKDGYEHRTEAPTFVEDASTYWNETRIERSGFYQYYVYEAAARLLRNRPWRRVADVGCGFPCKTEELIRPLCEEVTLIDQPSMEDVIRRNFVGMRFLAIDLQSPPLLDERFDCVVCADVVEHLLDPDPLMVFLRSITAPDGAVILSTPERDIERGTECMSSPMKDHVREWNADEFRRYVQSHGFDILEHRLLPKGRLPAVERFALPLLRPLNGARYSACQIAVCRVA